MSLCTEIERRKRALAWCYLYQVLIELKTQPSYFISVMVISSMFPLNTNYFLLLQIHGLLHKPIYIPILPHSVYKCARWALKVHYFKQDPIHITIIIITITYRHGVHAALHSTARKIFLKLKTQETWHAFSVQKT